MFLVLFNSISVLSGRRSGDNERLCAIESPLRLERFPPSAGLERHTSAELAKVNKIEEVGGLNNSLM